jgi:hypothetical protein
MSEFSHCAEGAFTAFLLKGLVSFTMHLMRQGMQQWNLIPNEYFKQLVDRGITFKGQNGNFLVLKNNFIRHLNFCLLNL